jgi:hypothetical protein
MSFKIGSEDENGSHRRGIEGWPYSIYIETDVVGRCDAVLCHGIQSLADAKQLLALCNGELSPALESPCQMFAWPSASRALQESD